MKLVIREYITMLKESGELDELLADLLLAMDLTPLIRPGTGSRQFGVDLSAVGTDTDGVVKLFLLTIKRSDITRRDWDTGLQAVRPSLNEIFDSFLLTRVLQEHQDLPKKIILATGGEIKQDVSPDWTNYVNIHSGQHPKYGNIEFDFWGADRLSGLIEEYFLDEYLFPDSMQKLLRKTIALADQNETEPRYFYELIDHLLVDKELPINASPSAQQKREKALRLLDLSLNVVFHWCKEADNLKPALLCAEQTVLRTWDWMRQNDLYDCSKTQNAYARIFFRTYLKIITSFAIKLHPYCTIRDGLFGHGGDELEYPLRTFELIGIYSSLSITHSLIAADLTDDQLKQHHANEAKAIAVTISRLINNNPAALTPCFDSHSIDIALGLLAMTASQLNDQAISWIDHLSSHIMIAYQIGRRFPISTDTYEDLVAMEVGKGLPKEKLMNISTILPMLAEWYAVLNCSDAYEEFQKRVIEIFKSTNFQMWYPDEKTEDYLYNSNAGYKSGATDTSIKLPPTLSELKNRILQIREARREFSILSCIEQGFPMLGLIASRHFRTPVIPEYWQEWIVEERTPVEE